MRRLHQDQTGGIKTEAVEAVAGRPAVGTPTIGRHDQDDLFPLAWRGKVWGAKVWGGKVWGAKAGEECRDEAEGGREGGLRFGHDFMQAATGEAAFREMGINDIEAQGERVAPALRFR